jgi:hypothetical protein
LGCEFGVWRHGRRVECCRSRGRTQQAIVEGIRDC